MGCKYSTAVDSRRAPAETINVGQQRDANGVLLADHAQQHGRCFNLKRDKPDDRDLLFAPAQHSKLKGEALPAAVDLRPDEAFAVYDQGNLGSCTANAIAAAFHLEQLRQGDKGFEPSRLFIYYNERDIEMSVGEDSGATLRDGMKAIHRKGVCDEAMWPYAVDKFTEQPPENCYTAGLANKCEKYARVKQTLEDLKGCLAAGLPFVFGFVVYNDFMTEEVAKSGKMSYPPSGQPQGGHAVHACGYDDELECFIVRNSWGECWADKGHFYMPYEYIVDPDLAFDFWAINTVEYAEFPIEDGGDGVIEVEYTTRCPCKCC